MRQYGFLVYRWLRASFGLDEMQSQDSDLQSQDEALTTQVATFTNMD